MPTWFNFQECTQEEGCTVVIQVEDGTMFYFHYPIEERRLYVKYEDREIVATLPNDTHEIDNMGAHGNALYFHSNKKIYKVVFTAPDTVTTTFLRDGIEGEKLDHYGGLCSRTSRNGKHYVYRMCDDPEQDAVLVDVPQKKMKHLHLDGVHRGKAIYGQPNTSIFHPYSLYEYPNELHPKVAKLSENVALVTRNVPWLSWYVRESSRYYYVANGEFTVLVVDTETMELLPILRLESRDLPIGGIVGVHEGKITLESNGGDDADTLYLMTAQLPDGYYEPTPTELPLELKGTEGSVEFKSVVESDDRLRTLTLEVERLTLRNQELTDALAASERRAAEAELSNRQLIDEKYSIFCAATAAAQAAQSVIAAAGPPTASTNASAAADNGAHWAQYFRQLTVKDRAAESEAAKTTN